MTEYQLAKNCLYTHRGDHPPNANPTGSALLIHLTACSSLPCSFGKEASGSVTHRAWRIALDWMERLRERNRRQRDRWRSIPNSSVALVMALGFCLFAAVGALVQLNSPTAFSPTVWILPLICGCFAAASLWVSVRVKSWWVLVLCVVFLGALRGIEHFSRLNSHTLPTSGEVQRWLSFTSELTIALIAIGWGWRCISSTRKVRDSFALKQRCGWQEKSIVPSSRTSIAK